MNYSEEPEHWRERQAALKEKGINGNGAGLPLTIAAQEFWATPETGHSPNGHGRRGGSAANGHQSGASLDNQAQEFWATPSASETRQGYQRRPPGMASRQNQQSLSTQAIDSHSPHLDPTTPQGGETSSRAGRGLRPQLSRLFVEWLMGTRLGTSCVCSLSHACAPEQHN